MKQDSLGYSPFELLYGRTVRGPVSILRELMTNEKVEPEVKTTYEYVFDLKDRLQSTCELAQTELQKSQIRQKKYYDRRTKVRTLRKKMKFWFCCQQIQTSCYYNGEAI